MSEERCAKCHTQTAEVKCKQCDEPLCADCGVEAHNKVFCDDACALRWEADQIEREGERQLEEATLARLQA
jgi:hypothetical protein